MTTSVTVNADTMADVRVVEVVTENTRTILKNGTSAEFTVFHGQTVYVQEIAEGDIPEDAVILGPKIVR